MCKISACLASYNGEKYISKQLESILKQISRHDEIIISDDLSTDSTIDQISNFNDSRIKVFVNNGNHGVISNFENALSKASGDIIFLSDQDDIWLDGKVQKMVKLLDTCDLVVSDCKVTNENLNTINESFFKLIKSGSGIIKNLYRNTYVGCCMAFNRKVLEYSLPFPSNIAMHDWWIGLVAELTGKVFFLEEPLILYRRHDNNASSTAKQSNANVLKKLKWRYIMAKELLIRYFEIKKMV